MIDTRYVRLFGIVAAVAPALAMFGVKVIGPEHSIVGKGPAQASADPIATPLVSQSQGRLTPEQVSAVEFAEAVSSRAIDGTPFYYPPAHIEDQTPVDPVPLPDEPVQLDRFEIRLTSVMGGSRPLAVINGRACGVGQIVAGQWTLSAIDARAGSATFTHPDGRTQTISVNDADEGPIHQGLAVPPGRP